MTENQTKAKHIIELSSVRPYCRKVELYIYDMSNPLKNGDCHDSFEDSLGNAIAYLFKIQNKFLNFPEINKKLIRQICYNRTKTINVIKKSTNQKLKVVFKSHPVQIVDWPKIESNLWTSTCAKQAQVE